MNKPILSSVLIASSLWLAGCGSGGGDSSDPLPAPPPPPPPAVGDIEISGTAVKGLLAGAAVSLFAPDSATPLASTQTDENGRYSLNFNASSGSYIIQIEGGEHLCDSAFAGDCGLDVAFGDAIPFTSRLSAVVPVELDESLEQQQQQLSANVTALTTSAAARFEQLRSDTDSSLAAARQANTEIAEVLMTLTGQDADFELLELPAPNLSELESLLAEEPLEQLGLEAISLGASLFSLTREGDSLDEVIQAFSSALASTGRLPETGPFSQTRLENNHLAHLGELTRLMQRSTELDADQQQRLQTLETQLQQRQTNLVTEADPEQLRAAEIEQAIALIETVNSVNMVIANLPENSEDEGGENTSLSLSLRGLLEFFLIQSELGVSALFFSEVIALAHEQLMLATTSDLLINQPLYQGISVSNDQNGIRLMGSLDFDEETSAFDLTFNPESTREGQVELGISGSLFDPADPQGSMISIPVSEENRVIVRTLPDTTELLDRLGITLALGQLLGGEGQPLQALNFVTTFSRRTINDPTINPAPNPDTIFSHTLNELVAPGSGNGVVTNTFSIGSPTSTVVSHEINATQQSFSQLIEDTFPITLRSDQEELSATIQAMFDVDAPGEIRLISQVSQTSEHQLTALLNELEDPGIAIVTDRRGTVIRSALTGQGFTALGNILGEVIGFSGERIGIIEQDDSSGERSIRFSDDTVVPLFT